MRAKAREAIKTEGGKTDEDIEEEVKKMLPDRDWDDEELDEQGTRKLLTRFTFPLRA
jgi:hypothetical protein